MLSQPDGVSGSFFRTNSAFEKGLLSFDCDSSIESFLALMKVVEYRLVPSNGPFLPFVWFR